LGGGRACRGRDRQEQRSCKPRSTVSSSAAGRARNRRRPLRYRTSVGRERGGVSSSTSPGPPATTSTRSPRRCGRKATKLRRASAAVSRRAKGGSPGRTRIVGTTPFAPLRRSRLPETSVAQDRGIVSSHVYHMGSLVIVRDLVENPEIYRSAFGANSAVVCASRRPRLSSTRRRPRHCRRQVFRISRPSPGSPRSTTAPGSMNSEARTAPKRRATHLRQGRRERVPPPRAGPAARRRPGRAAVRAADLAKVFERQEAKVSTILADVDPQTIAQKPKTDALPFLEPERTLRATSSPNWDPLNHPAPRPTDDGVSVTNLDGEGARVSSRRPA